MLIRPEPSADEAAAIAAALELFGLLGGAGAGGGSGVGSVAGGLAGERASGPMEPSERDQLAWRFSGRSWAAGGAGRSAGAARSERSGLLGAAGSWSSRQ